MKSEALGLLLAMVFVFPQSVGAAGRKFTVLVNVPIENELTDSTKSFVNRELRQLNDVELVDRKGDYFISIVPVPLKLKDGVIAGVAVSYVFQQGDLVMHYVLTGSPNDLKSLCEELVSTFDTKFLEPNRHN